MINKLRIGHFKAIASAEIPLGPITVLVGPNDSGKSTILQALMALSRAGDARRFHAAELLGASTTKASRHTTVPHRASSSKPQEPPSFVRMQAHPATAT